MLMVAGSCPKKRSDTAFLADNPDRQRHIIEEEGIRAGNEKSFLIACFAALTRSETSPSIAPIIGSHQKSDQHWQE